MYKWTVYVAEVLKNLRVIPARVILVGLLSVFAGAAVTWWPLHEVSGMEGRWREDVRAGRFVVTLTPTAGTVPASRCDSLERMPGVLAAGGVTGVREFESITAPGQRYEWLTVSTGYLRALWPAFQPASATEPGVIVGKRVAADLGVREGDTVVSTSGADYTVVEVLRTSYRSDGADRQVFELSPPSGLVNDCTVSMRPAYEGQLIPLLSATIDSSVSSLAPTREGELTPEMQLQTRPSTFIGIASGAVTALLITIVWYTRRSEFGLYLAFGLGRTQLATALSIEALLLIVLPAGFGFALGALAAGQEALDASLAAAAAQSSALTFLAALVFAVPVGLVILSRAGEAESFKQV